MKKLILTLALLPSLAGAAPITSQWIAPGNGISGASIINAPNTLWDRQTIAAVMAALQKNVPGGVAGLNMNGAMTAPLLSASGTFGVQSQTAYPSMYVGQDMTAVLGSPLVGNNTLQMGGTPLGTVANSPMGSPGLPQSLVISSHPDGPFNNGCGLCLFTTGGQQNTMLAELGGDDYEGDSRIVPISFDTAGIYWEAGSRQARLVLPVSAYTTTTATLSVSLTPQQLLLIHQGQYIITNSADPAASDTETWDNPHFLAGIVRSVDNTGPTAVITVWAWNRMGHSGASQTPSLTGLDTFYFPKTPAPAVFVGSPTKVFGFNTMMQYDGAFTGAGTRDTSSVHQLEWGEVDVNVQNETRAGALSYHGLTFGGGQSVPAGASITPGQVFTSESYELMLANDMPHHLEIADACGNMAIDTNQLYLPSACSLFALTPVGAVYDFDMTELHQIVAGYNERLVTHITSDGTGTGSYTNATLRFGPRINGTKGNTSSTDTASLLGEIDFPGSTGGVALCGYGVNCGLSVAGNGDVSLAGALNVAGGATFKNQVSVNANLVTTGTTYYQNTAGDNIVAVAASTDASKNNVLAYSSLASGGASVLFNLPTTVGNDLTVTGGLETHGNAVIGGYGGSTLFKDGVTFNQQITAKSNIVLQGTQFFQSPSGSNIAQLLEQTDASSGDTSVVLSGLGQNTHFDIDIPTNLNSDLLITGGLTSHGNTVLGGFGGSISMKDATTISADMTVTGSGTIQGNLTVGGNGGTTVMKDGVVLTSLNGAGNAYACLNSSGQLYRSATACN